MVHVRKSLQEYLHYYQGLGKGSLASESVESLVVIHLLYIMLVRFLDTTLFYAFL